MNIPDSTLSSFWKVNYILFTNILTIKSSGKRFLNTKIEKIAATRIKHASLNISIEPSTLIEAEICALKIF